MKAFPRRFLTIALVVGMAVTASATAGAAHAASSTDAGSAKASHRLAEALRAAIDAQNFADVLDTTPPGSRTASLNTSDLGEDGYDTPLAALVQQFSAAVEAQPLHQMPNMDAAIIELDGQGRPRAMANVLLSPQYPHGVVVPMDRKTISTERVRYRWWDDDEWDAYGGQGSRDVLAGREQAPIDFTSPYPASVLKLMVGFGVLRMADAGRISLDADYAYQPTEAREACGGATTKPIRQYFDDMITMSQNEATCALVKMIHDHQAMDELNQTFVDLGMPTLMITGTNPANGGRWIGSNMSGIDTAKLLLLLNGGPGTLWTTPAGAPVTRDVLSENSRQLYLATLGDQGHNEMLSTTNWCGRGYPAPGIPQRTPQRWIHPTDGTMTVGDAIYGQDVRPCDAAAEVTFAHKTGWTDTTGSDAGIVHSLPGKPSRDYIVVVFSNLGTDYIDAHRPADPADIYPVPYTEKYAHLGAAIDTIVTGLRH